MCSAQPQPSRSKQHQTRQRSNSGTVLPRYARPLGIRRKLSERLAVKVPTPVLHKLAVNQIYICQTKYSAAGRFRHVPLGTASITHL
jgi:hypothetical protein